MNEKDFGDALLRWNAHGQTPQIDPQRLVESVLARDRRRVRWLTAATMVLWLLAALGIPLFTYFLAVSVWPQYNWMMEEIITHKDGMKPQELVDSVFLVTEITAKLSIVLVCGSVAALILAAGATIWLVFATRRATLREVNANLAEISAQLKRLAPQS